MKLRGSSRLGLGLAAVLALLMTTPMSVASATSASVLRYADSAASYAYTLKLVKTCEVGDGLAIVKNVGLTPLRLTSIAVLYGDGANANQAKVSFELVSLRRGTSEGQLGATFDLTSTKGAVDIGNAIGGVVQPISTSGRSYDLVVKVLAIVDHAKRWKIVGLRVAYDVGAHSYTTVLAQSITLSPTPGC
jgi:hypothetical protein